MMNLLARIRARVRGKGGTTFVSFTNPLKQVCGTMPLKTIVEFGPGYSTEIFLANSDAQIISFETDRVWYKKYRQRFDPARVQVVYKEPGWDLAEISQYGEDFSMFFIDGGDRIKALRTAFELLDLHGVAYLHDAHREVYEPGLRLFPYCYFPERHSCLLTKDSGVQELLKSAIPVDYSCNCQYCSTVARQDYFNQFAENEGFSEEAS